MSEKKFDANETAFLLQQLEFLKSEEIPVEYALPKALNFIPMKSNVPAGASSFAYFEMDRRGFADFLANGASDINFVDVDASKQLGPVERIAVGYKYSYDDLASSRMSGMPLDQHRRMAARQALIEKIDDIAALGNADRGFKGFANHPNVTILAAANPGSGSDTSWQGGDKTAMEILNDLNTMVGNIRTNTKDRHRANALLVDVSNYEFLRLTPLDSSGTNSDSILSAFQKNNPGVLVESWTMLENADAAGTGPRAICYEKSPFNMEFVVADAIQEHDPVYKHLMWEIPMTAKIGGTVIYRPRTLVYMDGI